MAKNNVAASMKAPVMVERPKRIMNSSMFKSDLGENSASCRQPVLVIAN
jgi:hypothetical protein